MLILHHSAVEMSRIIDIFMDPEQELSTHYVVAKGG
jgi:hypothetical protein